MGNLMHYNAPLLRRSAVQMLKSTLTAFAALTLFSPTITAQTVDEIIAKNIQARGGLEKLQSVSSLRQTGIFSAGSFRAQVVQENKRPDKVREEFIIQGMAQVQAYDGKTGWQVSPFEGRRDPELLSQDDMKGLVVDADMDDPLVDYQQKGHKAELVGHDSVEGTDCYKIKLTLKNGDVRTYYLDTDSFLELKIDIQRTIRGAIQESEQYFGDYDQVNGVYFPFAFESAEKGDPNRTKFTVDKIEINLPLDDNRFAMPAAPAKTAGKSGAGN